MKDKGPLRLFVIVALAVMLPYSLMAMTTSSFAEGDNVVPTTTMQAQVGLESPNISVQTDRSDVANETFRNPPEITSSGGILNATLRAERKEIDIAGQKVMATVYNGL